MCGANTYTITSATVSRVTHEGTFTGTPTGVVAVDDRGNEYRIVGAVWGGLTFNAPTGGFQTTFTGKLQIVSQGGRSADSVNVVFHVSPNGNINEFNFGTCAF